MSLMLRYKIATPRLDLREGKPLGAAEFAVHLDDARNNCAPPDYQRPDRVFVRTHLTTFPEQDHQSMILFSAGRREVPRRFLLTDGAGNDQHFWRLAQALSALYPATTDEKRWVDGVFSQKKGLGL